MRLVNVLPFIRGVAREPQSFTVDQIMEKLQQPTGDCWKT